MRRMSPQLNPIAVIQVLPFYTYLHTIHHRDARAVQGANDMHPIYLHALTTDPDLN